MLFEELRISSATVWCVKSISPVEGPRLIVSLYSCLQSHNENKSVTMRILFWSELFWPHIGGAEVFGSKLLTALRERFHDILVVTRQDSPDLPLEDHYRGIPVHRFPFGTAIVNRNVD